MHSWDAAFYIAAQFLGAIGGLALAAYLLRGAPANQTIRYAVTAPGLYGKLAAFIAELTISFISMSTVLFVSNTERIARFTPYFVGVLVATYIIFETPLSGMSMSPARTFGSAFHAGYWHSLWIYFVAPTFGMLSAAQPGRRLKPGDLHLWPNCFLELPLRRGVRNASFRCPEGFGRRLSKDRIK